jgi:hypothetical protein
MTRRPGPPPRERGLAKEAMRGGACSKKTDDLAAAKSFQADAARCRHALSIGRLHEPHDGRERIGVAAEADRKRPPTRGHKSTAEGASLAIAAYPCSLARRRGCVRRVLRPGHRRSVLQTEPTAGQAAVTVVRETATNRSLRFLDEQRNSGLCGTCEGSPGGTRSSPGPHSTQRPSRPPPQAGRAVADDVQLPPDVSDRRQTFTDARAVATAAVEVGMTNGLVSGGPRLPFGTHQTFRMGQVPKRALWAVSPDVEVASAAGSATPSAVSSYERRPRWRVRRVQEAATPTKDAAPSDIGRSRTRNATGNALVSQSCGSAGC